MNTFREAVRDRVLYGVLAFATAVLLFSLALAELSLNQEQRIVRNIGMASISLFTVLVGVFLGSSLLYKEIERKTLYVILPKPIHRAEFLVGKFFGIGLTGAVFVMTMGFVQFWVMALQAGLGFWIMSLVPGALALALALGLWRVRDRTAVLIPWSFLAIVAGLFLLWKANIAVFPMAAMLSLSIAELVVLSSVALLFSSFSTPFLTGVLTFGVWVAGRSAHEMATMKSKVLAPAIRSVMHVLAEVVPNFSLYVPGYRALSLQLHDQGGAVQYLGMTLGYTVFYSAILLLFAALLFRKRDFL
ncbi:MAG: ABC transporter permease [Myxococcales bacterium]|nr:MAG: ABC transporter permease [Myxococcales bacterium]